MRETIEGIVREMRNKANQADFILCGNVDSSFVRVFANRIEAAHDREVEELKTKVAAKDAEIARLKAALKTCVDYVKCEYGCGSECDAACEEIESGCKLREWTIEFGLETLDRKGTENGK